MKKFTEQLAKELTDAIAKSADMFSSIKAAGDGNGTFRVVATTQGKDRDGEIVLQEGLDITNYMKNPVILFGHDYWSLPIGKATKVEKNAETGQTIIEGVFASEEANPIAQQVRRLYEAGILVAVSIGFIAKEWEGNVVTESELLELSFVPVPANPDALDTVKELHLEADLKAAFGFATKQGFALEGAYAKFYEDAKTSEPTEAKEITLASISEKLDNVIAGLVTVSEVKELLSNVDAKLTSIAETKSAEAVALEGAGQPNGEEALKALLGDVHKSGQEIAKLANNINHALKKQVNK